MKRVAFLVACLCMLAFAGCGLLSDGSLASGIYTTAGEAAAYVSLDMDDNAVAIGESLLYSYAELGTFVLLGDTLIATTQSGVFTFDIRDSETLLLTDNSGLDTFLPVGTEFTYNADWEDISHT